MFCLALGLFHSAHEQATPAYACNIYSSLIYRGLLPFFYEYIQFKREKKSRWRFSILNWLQVTLHSCCVIPLRYASHSECWRHIKWESDVAVWKKNKTNETTMLVLAGNRRSAQRVISLWSFIRRQQSQRRSPPRLETTARRRRLQAGVC